MINKKNKAFTLIELIITILIASILIMIATPSFVSLVKDARLTSQINDLVGSLVYARSEAIKRNATVIVKAVDSSWANGWEVIDANDNVLREYPSIKGGNSLSCSDDCEDLTFFGGGNTDSLHTLTLCDSNDTSKGRIISLQITGRLTRPASVNNECSD